MYRKQLIFKERQTCDDTPPSNRGGVIFCITLKIARYHNDLAIFANATRVPPPARWPFLGRRNPDFLKKAQILRFKRV